MSETDTLPALDSAAHGGCPSATCYASSDGLVTLYLGDCRKLLPTIKADAIISDPPYGFGYDPSRNRKDQRTQKGLNMTDRNWKQIDGEAEAFDPRAMLCAPIVLLWERTTTRTSCQAPSGGSYGTSGMERQATTKATLSWRGATSAEACECTGNCGAASPVRERKTSHPLARNYTHTRSPCISWRGVWIRPE